MKIKEIQAKSIITKSKLPASDFVINPYVGCQHGCIYCYANFMKRFTGHEEKWGDFVDVKINAPDLIKNLQKYKGKFITIGSVTDAYQPIEAKYKLMRGILEKLADADLEFDIITKSDLVLRDIDLLKKCKCIVAVSLSNLDDEIRQKIEPCASSVERRINALRELHKAGIKTALFMSPIFPEISDWQAIIERTKNFVDEYWFENLNLYPAVSEAVFGFLKKNKPELAEFYKNLPTDYWDKLESEIKDYCNKERLDCSVFFHHKEIRK